MASFFEVHPADTKALWPRFNFGDGGGAIHVKLGWNWSLVEFFEKQFGVTVDYLNFGGSSTTSAPTEQNGLWPARMDPVLASGGHLMVLAFGTNEKMQESTYENVKEIIVRAKAAGMDVIVMPYPRVNPLGGQDTLSQWMFTNRKLYEAAIDGAAYCPADWLTAGPGGGVPVHLESFSGANWFNHPGPVEFAAYGRALCDLFAG